MSGDVLDYLATKICAVGPDTLSDDDRERARLRIFDTLLAAVAGLRAFDGDETAPVIPGAGESDAVSILAIGARFTEVDDIAIAGCVTPGAIVVPVVLGLSPTVAADDSTVLAAVAVGYETATAVGDMIDGANILGTGLWPTLLVAPFAAAAAAAVLLRLDHRSTLAALRLAAEHTAGPPRATQGRHGRLLALASAIRAGLSAATDACNQPALPDDTARRWAASYGVNITEARARAHFIPGLMLADIDTKPFPTARQALAAVEGVSRLAEGLAPDTIRAVDIAVPTRWLRMIGRTAPPNDRIGSLLSIAYQAGLALLHPSELVSVARRNLPQDEAMHTFLGKVSVDGGFQAATAEGEWGASVRLLTDDGRSRTITVTATTGSASRQPGWTFLEDKMLRIFANDPEALATAHALRSAIHGLARTTGDNRRIVQAALAPLVKGRIVAETHP